MKKSSFRNLFMGLLMLVFCMTLTQKADVRAASFGLDGTTFIDGVKDKMYIDKRQGTKNDYIVRMDAKGMQNVYFLWVATKSGNTYSGRVTGLSRDGVNFIDFTSTNSTLSLRKISNKVFYLKYNVNGAKDEGKIKEQYRSLKISKKSASLYPGGQVQLGITLGGAAKDASWSSSKKSVATVSSSGLVTAKKAGKTTITAKINGRKVTCKITVKKPTVKLNKKKATLKAGAVLQLSASVKGSSLPVKWSSSKKSVATVSSSGLVTAKKKGTAKITAKLGGVKVTCTVKVTK